ncbi:MAG: DUF2283 domain-containing protein [Thaumarchaeota archaeon]|nr:DUF2283 domain-containing protein [Nitrososphaerota archaeon]
MAKSVSLAINAETLANKIAKEYRLRLPPKIVMWHYDEEADTLYLHFKYPTKAVDSQIIVGRNQEKFIVNMTIINASMITWSTSEHFKRRIVD